MRAIIDTIKISNYKFVMEFDSGGEPDYPYTLWVYKDGKPFTFHNTKTQIRKEFKENYSKVHVKNFCSKFVNNEEYRNSFINSFNA